MGLLASGMSSYAQRSRSFDWEALKSTAPLTPRVRAHLTQVYTTLCGTVLVAALGTFSHMLYNVGGALTAIASIATLVWLLATPEQFNEQKRAAILMCFSFFQGCTIGPLVEYAYAINPEIIVTAFMGTVCIFACFSAFSMFSDRRTSLYLGGIVASGLSLLFWLSIANIFLRVEWIVNIQLYLGLLVFVGFVVVDTQMIIEKASQGSTDYVRHTLELFLDFVNIFIRLLAILGKKEEKKSSSSRR